MVDRCVNLIDILENGKLDLNSSALENLFSNIDCKISILTIINETEKHDFQLFNYILRYLINAGKLDWIYTTPHEEIKSSKLTSNKDNSNNKIINGVKVWPKLLYSSKNFGNKNINEKIAVILMEVNLNENVGKDVKQKLINFANAISSELIVNCRKEIKESIILSLIKSFEFKDKFKEKISKNLRFLVQEWDSSTLKFKYGEEGGALYFKSILNDIKIVNIDQYCAGIKCFLMPTFKSFHKFEDKSLNEYNIEFSKYVALFINNLFDSNGIAVANLNSDQCITMIKELIISGETYSQSPEDSNSDSHENLINEKYVNHSQSIQSLPGIKSVPKENLVFQFQKPKPLPKPRLKPKPQAESVSTRLDYKVNNVEYENNIELKSKTSKNFELFAEECKQIYKDLVENHLKENEMTSNLIEIRNILEAKFKDYIKNSNEERLKIQFENLLTELLNQSLNKNINEEKSSIRKDYIKQLKFIIDFVKDENELRQKHEENLKIIIDNYLTNNPIRAEDEESVIKQFTEDLDKDFRSVLDKYRLKNKNSETNHNRALENAKDYYKREMDKHFVEGKFIIPNDLQNLHEKYKSLAHNELREVMPENGAIPMISQQLDQSIEVIFGKYKRQNLTNMPVKQAIGIDLGTTYSCVGVMNRGKVHIILHEEDKSTTPSYVSYDENGLEKLVGFYAKEESFSDPYNTIYDAKRMIGRKYNDEQIQNDLKLWPFEVVNVNDSLKIQLFNENKTTLSPEEVSAEILKKLKQDAEDFLGYEVENAVITVPAYFNNAQRQETKEAGILAGLNVLQILDEPTAAAIAYSHQIKDDLCKNILIYDLGGGTFDVAVVAIDKGEIVVRAINGDIHLGGEDFDQRLINYLYKKQEENFRKAADKNELKKAIAKLKIQCEHKKWILSKADSARISISQLLPGWDFKEKIMRLTFEELCMDLFLKTISIVDETLKSAQMKKSDINEILLIGGSIKIPKIQSLLKIYFDGKHLSTEIKPDEAVAYGATIQAAILNGEKFDQEFPVAKQEYMNALENAKYFYIREMDKHFVEPKFIIIKELQNLHDKYKSLAHDELRKEISEERVIPMISQMLYPMLETIFNQYKKQNLTNMPVKQAIGIDLGTTYCCVGVMNRGKVHIILHEEEKSTIPSYVSYDENGLEKFVGFYAKEESFSDPYNTIYDAKRMIGRNYNDKQIQNDIKLWPFEVVNVNDSLKIQLYNEEKTTLYPEQVSAEILKKLKKEAEDFLGYKVESAVITVPAYFNDAQRQATKDAGVLAGLNVMQILNEPTAAAIAYTHQIKNVIRKNILIYDLGGGTFDVAVVVIDKGEVDVRAVGGDTHLGGEDFDQRILQFFYNKYKENFQICDKEAIKRALVRLKIKCEKHKWILSRVSSATISLPVLLPGWDFKETMKRTDFENICMDLFKKTISIVDETLKNANMNKSEITEIVLIGGSTKIPQIQSLLKDYFKDKPLNKQIKPDEAVAYGATIQAALLNGEKFSDSFSVIPHDVAPFSLGIELKDKSMAVIIPRNSKLPTERTQRFLTSKDNQSHVFIQIFEGENFKTAKHNRLLGSFTIDGLPKKPKGKEHIDVTFCIDDEGIFHVKGETSVKSTNLTIKDHRGRITPEEMLALANSGNRLKSKSIPA